VSLTDLYRFGLEPTAAQCVRNAQFLHHELPIRFAQRVVDLKELPFGLSEHHLVQQSIGHFEDTVQKLASLKQPNVSEEEEDFACLIASVLLDHRQVPMALACALRELHKARRLSGDEQKLLDRRLDDFFMARISMRFLIEHYIASHACHEGFSGVIASACNPFEIVQQASEDVGILCRHQLGVCPEIEVIGDAWRTFRYVPSHLYFVACELLKNSVRAVVQNSEASKAGTLGAASAGGAGSDGAALPPVRAILVCGGETDQFESVSIKIEDQGGGVRRSEMDDMWSYTYTTASYNFDQDMSFPNATASLCQSGNMKSHMEDPIAGLGIGLPLSRLYARYFGGSLDLLSMEKYGMDAYLSLPHFGDDMEILPPPVAASPSQFGSCSKGRNYQAQ